MSETIERVTQVFRDVFRDETITITPETTSADIEGWDSLTHVNLLISIEREFGVRFQSTEVANLANVGSLLELVEAYQPQ